MKVPEHHHHDTDLPDWEAAYAGDAPVWSGRPNQALVDELADLSPGDPPGRALDVGLRTKRDARKPKGSPHRRASSAIRQPQSASHRV